MYFRYVKHSKISTAVRLANWDFNPSGHNRIREGFKTEKTSLHKATKKLISFQVANETKPKHPHNNNQFTRNAHTTKYI